MYRRSDMRASKFYNPGSEGGYANVAVGGGVEKERAIATVLR